MTKPPCHHHIEYDISNSTVSPNTQPIFKNNNGSLDFPGGTVDKSLPANARNMSSLPGLERFTWRGATKPLHHNF